jgi:hypothetical protein
MFAGMMDAKQYFMLTESNDWEPLPKVSDLDATAVELVALADEVNHARLEGFLHEALNDKRAADGGRKRNPCASGIFSSTVS